MKKLSILPLLCLVFNSMAQDAYHNALNALLQADYNLPSLSQWSLPNTETATFNGSTSYGAIVSTIVPNGQSFSQARNFVVSQGNNPWDAAHLYRNTTAIAANDKCLLVIWMRSPTPSSKVNILAENSTTYEKEALATVNISNTWKMFAIPFAASASYAINTLSIGVQMAYLNQTIELGGMACLNYKNTVQLPAMPILLNNDSYPGIEPDAPWRAEAAASIEQLRKANLTVQVKDANGNPLPNAQVYLEMQQHAFKFGTAVISNRFGGGNGQDDTYEQKMLNLDGNGHGFNEVVFENDLKWPAWEQHWYSSQAEISVAVQWLHDQDISIRGHNLVWPGWGYSPPDIEQNQNNPNYLLSRIRNHIKNILSYPGVGTEMADWDVLNEITQNNDYANALAGTPGFVTGRELYAQVFKQADSLAPNSVMYLNDYVAIEQGDTPGNGIGLWKSRLNELMAANAPVEGIGFQGHFGASPTGIPRVKEIYDDFWATYGLPAKISEYDISNLVPAQTQAQYMRDILTISFAHPSLKGFLMWGFWDGAHWLGNAPIYNLDWSLKPSGEAYIDQIFHQWWTNTSAQANSQGEATLRGFKGKYRLRVACNNAIQEQDVVLENDTLVSVVLNCSTRVRDLETAQDFKISPNPANHQLTVRWETPALPKRLSVFNSIGQLMYQAEPQYGDNFIAIGVGLWPNGPYVVRADYGNASKHQTVVVQH